MRADWTAISAVSRSRISPTRIMSGSCLRMALRPFAKVMSASLLEAVREGDVGQLVDLALVDVLEHVLDRVFDRHDVADLLV